MFFYGKVQHDKVRQKNIELGSWLERAPFPVYFKLLWSGAIPSSSQCLACTDQIWSDSFLALFFLLLRFRFGSVNSRVWGCEQKLFQSTLLLKTQVQVTNKGIFAMEIVYPDNMAKCFYPFGTGSQIYLSSSGSAHVSGRYRIYRVWVTTYRQLFTQLPRDACCA